MKTSIFSAIEDAIINYRIWDFSTMWMKLNQLFSRNTSRFFIKKIKTNILKIMFKFLSAIKQVERWYFKIKSFWITESVVADNSISFSKTSKETNNQKNHSSQSFISKSLLHSFENVVFDFIAFHSSKEMQVDFRLQTFRAMRRSASVITIQNSFSRDLKKFRKTRRH